MAVYFFSFFIPLTILLIVYIELGMVPFGNKTILICDMSGQYVDFYSTYYEILTGGKSLLYSWHAGLGLNFIGIFAYYLSSPFSLLIVLPGKEHLPESLMLITLLKVGSCGLAFAIYARKTLKLSHIPVIIFSLLYALSAYSIVYTFNLMWLDGVIFLPLVLLGAEKILQENKYLFFLFCLLYIFVANFYLAYMVCIFAFLYFLAAFFANHAFSEIRLFLRKLLLFACSALLAAGCAAVLLIPAYYALKNGQGGPDLSLFHWKLNFDLLDLFSKTPLGAYDTLKYDGLPNIYCGLVPLLLAPIYFLNKKIPGKERIIYALLLSFLVISFNFANLNFAWHAFDRPDWFPYRYSFVFSFLLILLSCRSFSTLERSDAPMIFKVGAIWILIILIMQKMNYPYLSDRFLTLSISLLGFYALLLAGLVTLKSRKKMLLSLLFTLVLLESSLSSWYLITRMDQEFSYVTTEEYNRTINNIHDIQNRIYSLDQTFYRLDRIGGRTFNDPMNLNYNGITHFSSMSNAAMNRTLRQLGFLTTAGYKSINFAGSTPLTESLLGIKYVIAAADKGLGYKKTVSSGEYSAYLNNYSLPLAFLADKSLLEFDPSKEDNPFRLQNSLINLALGNTAAAGYFLPIAASGINLNNVAVTKEAVRGKETEKYTRISNSIEGSVEFTLINPEDQQVYTCLQTIENDVRIFVNGEEIKGYLPVYNKRIIDLGYHQRNEQLRIKITFRNDGFSLAQKYFYGLNETNLAKALAPLQSGKMKNIEVTDTSVKGKVTVKDKTLLFTSIPYDQGWKAMADGQKVTISKIGNAFIGVELPEGTHQISFIFRPEGFRLGMVISGISLVVLCFVVYRKVRKNA